MTNSEQAIREFADGIMKSHETWGKPWNAEMREEGIEEIMEITTALISEHYVAKAAYIALENTLAKAEAKNLELLQQRDELLKTMKSIYCTTDASDQNSMQHAIYKIGAAIKNTER